jgi:predicted GIY-YIG superfamily endonuclease
MHEGGYYTYIMASRSHTFYIGVTGNLLRRVFQHKWREHDGFTQRCNCDRLVWFGATMTYTRPFRGKRNSRDGGARRGSP